MKFPPVKEQMDLIQRGSEELVSPEELEQKLERASSSGKPLKIKLGADPSRPDLHIGHAVVLKKLRQFQDLGHTAILIIGDFTASIGDPTGRNKTRPSISLTEARQHGESYLEQATIILDRERLEVVYNSDWLNQMNFSDVIKLAGQYTVAQMLERDDFSKRYRQGTPISVHEFLYPLAQGQDSVHLRSDLELGGTDQLFNFLVARELQRKAGSKPQVILTMPLLEGTDGVEKMSKSYDNYIGLTDPADQIYGKILSIPDELILKYMMLTTSMTDDEIEIVKESLKAGKNPRDFKRQLGRALVELYYGPDTALKAEQAFDQVFIRKDVPDDMPEIHIVSSEGAKLLDILERSGLFASRGEIRRLFKQSAIKMNGSVVRDEFHSFTKSGESVIKAGKRKFLRIICE